MPSRRQLLMGTGAAMTVSLSGCNLLQDDSGEQPDVGNGGDDGGGGQQTVSQQDIPDGPLRIVYVDIMSGPGSVYGEESRAVLNVLLDDINSNGGILGEREVEIVAEVDEAQGGVDSVISSIRSAVTQNDVDAVWGLLFDHITRAAVPVLGDLNTLTIGGAGGHFNREKYLLPDSPDYNEYFIRPMTLDTVGSSGAALYAAKYLPEATRVAGVNQDYAWGQDAWDIFSKTISAVRPDIQVGPDIKTAIAPSDFSPHVSKLNEANPDIVFCSAFGPYVMNLLQAGEAQGLWGERYSSTKPIFSLGVEMLRKFGQQDILEGALFTSRGAHIPNLLYDENPQHKEFVDALRDEGIAYPSHQSYHWYRIVKTHVAAIENYYSMTGSYPTNKQIANFTRGNSIFTLPGYPLALPNNQGYSPGMVGEAVNPDGLDTPVIQNYELIPAFLCNPYPNMKTTDWIENGIIQAGWTKPDDSPLGG